MKVLYVCTANICRSPSAEALLRRAGVPGVEVASAGTAAVLLCAAQVALFLGLSNDALTGTAKIVFAAHIPLALIEGAVTVLVVAFLRKAAPDLLRGVEKS